jgi:predicted enzyme related to lactoylglutathione lyase
MKIKLTTIYVDDQEKALGFYTSVLGLAKKNDFSNGGYRWLTVTSPDDANGVELQLALSDNPAGKAYQQALFAQNQPALMLFSDDIKADAERIKGKGGTLSMEPTDTTGSTIAQIKDGVGNLIQITQLKW